MRGRGATEDRFEAALRDLFAFEPRPPLLAGLDERVLQAVATSGAVQPSKPRRLGLRRMGLRHRRKMIGLLVAAVVVIGAGGALAMYEGMGPVGDVGFGLQLDRSVEVGATAVHDGYRVTIDRAYLDAERLMLGIRVTDELERPEVRQLMAMYTVVADGAGKWQGAGAATSRPLGQWTATNVVTLLAPAGADPASSRRLHIVVPHIFFYDSTASPPVEDDTEWDPLRKVMGPWTFDIDLAVDGVAAVAEPGVVKTIDGIPVTLTQVVIGSSAIRAKVEINDGAAGTWTLIGHVRRGDEVFRVTLVSLSVDGAVQMQTDGGTDDASGDWSLVITEARRIGTGDAPEEELAGPWRFDFQIP
jgi:hypothetical protein